MNNLSFAVEEKRKISLHATWPNVIQICLHATRQNVIQCMHKDMLICNITKRISEWHWCTHKVMLTCNMTKCISRRHWCTRKDMFTCTITKRITISIDSNIVKCNLGWHWCMYIDMLICNMTKYNLGWHDSVGSFPTGCIGCPAFRIQKVETLCLIFKISI